MHNQNMYINSLNVTTSSVQVLLYICGFITKLKMQSIILFGALFLTALATVTHAETEVKVVHFKTGFKCNFVFNI